MKYEAVIGLEIHVELSTRSKLFCGCSTAFGAEPNSNCCPVCLGLPGTLPVLNRRAVELAVMAALALDCSVQELCRFDRKNYYYPDLPKAYQISQYDRPLALGGGLDVDFPGGTRRIRLERVHLEEEAGKLIHAGDSIMNAAYSLVDYNRAGIPLLEIVTAPDLRSGKEARLFLEALRTLLRYTGVSDVKMEQGSLRCDANISLRPPGSGKLGVKTEVKNMNSFRAVELALDYEARRQAEIMERGGVVVQQTCHWDEERKVTVPLRSKEGSADYRYFPEPDLLPLRLECSFIEALKNELPELPQRRSRRLQEQYGLEPREAAFLTATRETADFFEAAAESYSDYRNLANWIQGELIYQLRETGLEISAVDPGLLVELLQMLDSGEINRPTAKELLPELLQSGTSPLLLVQKRGLGRICGRAALEPLVERVLAENSDAAESFRQGKEKALAFLVGRVMALTGGRADTGEVNELLREKLSPSP
ncbi:MAG TPA: Asp-tRNA(Asn)/Glu-tRNA(Gln) amidotransferase subunit GatB [Bacillota bacterium]|nr:Asp-tRNA(Asn)/Glu-tRNA(Gln) amidotransferase subunit GatB [Bacillota bacterium]